MADGASSSGSEKIKKGLGYLFQLFTGWRSSSSAVRQPRGKVMLIDCNEPRMTNLANALRELNPRLRVHQFDTGRDNIVLKIRHKKCDLAILRYAEPDIVAQDTLPLIRWITGPIIAFFSTPRPDRDFFRDCVEEIINEPIGTERLRAVLEKYHLLLPAAPEEAAGAALQAASPPPAPLEPQTRKVLLIDPNVERRARLSFNLRLLNPRLVVEECDQEFNFREATTVKYHHAFVRHELPQMDGRRTLRKLKRYIKMGGRVIVITVHAEDRSRFMRHGAREVIVGLEDAEGRNNLENLQLLLDGLRLLGLAPGDPQ